MEKTKSLPSQEGSPVFDQLMVAQTAKFLDEVLFVVTLYRLPLGYCKAWVSLETALSHYGLRASVFIFDNGPKAQQLPVSNHVTPQYQHDATNPGISRAYNTAYEVARRDGKHWLLFLDQDTSVDADALAKYATSVNANPTQSLFAPVVLDSKGVLSPFRFSMGRGVRVATFSSPFLSLHEFRAINAGLLVSCDLFKLAGGYDEGISLDFSDIAFLEKVKPISNSLCLVDATLEQQFSGSTLLDARADMERFKKYNEGGLQFARRFGRRFPIRWGAFLRAVKLTVQWRRVGFLRIHFNTWRE